MGVAFGHEYIRTRNVETKWCVGPNERFTATLSDDALEHVKSAFDAIKYRVTFGGPKGFTQIFHIDLWFQRGYRVQYTDGSKGYKYHITTVVYDDELHLETQIKVRAVVTSNCLLLWPRSRPSP